MSAPHVYLAGGLKTDWQDKVRDAIADDVEWFDPRELDQTQGMRGLVKDEMFCLLHSDILFAYAEASNPLPVGLAWEMGFVTARENERPIIVILVDERGMEWLGATATHHVRTLDEGLGLLRAAVKTTAEWMSRWPRY